MRTFIVTLVTFLLILSCDEESPQPVSDPVVGSWNYTNPDLDMNLTFDMTSVNNEYVLSNIELDYLDVPDNATFTTEVYQEGVNEFERILISASWTVTPCDDMFCEKWVIVSFWWTSVQEKTVNPKTYQMSVEEMTVGRINTDQVELEDQVLIRD